MAKNRGDYFSDMQSMPDEDDSRPGQNALVVLDDEDLSEDDIQALAHQEEEDEKPRPDSFDQNLVDKLDDNERFLIGQQLRELYDVDVQSREQWERKMEMGMEIIGLEDVPLERTAFEGAAQVNHPALAEAMVQFQARAVEELLPPAGPVQCIIEGVYTDDKEEQRERVEDYMNYQLTEEDDQYYWDTDSMLFYLPYAGSAFKKVSIYPITGTTRSRFVRGTDLVVPYSAMSLATAPRYTHVYTMPKNDYLRAVDIGFFLDADLPQQSFEDGEGENHRVLQDMADSRSPSSHPDDTTYTLCETHVDWHFDWETEGGETRFKKPYVITWEYTTGQVVRVQRLWKEDDPKCLKEVWFVHYKYLPGLGFYGFGLLHLIGSLGRAASGALRAVLDGSTTASMQGGFKSRDARMAGDFVFQPGIWQDVDMTAEELSKSFYTPPFKEPSPALFQTLEILVNGMQRFASTTEAMVGDAPNNAPVGTTVAMIEQASKVFSGIHKRLHLGARQEFKLIAESNYRYMSQDEYPYDVRDASRKIFRQDFDGQVRVVPVSDPNIFSSTQRIAIGQSVLQTVGGAPDVFDRRAKVKALKHFFKALKVPEWEEYFPDDMDRRMDPVTENQAMLGGIATKAFAEQDHESHIQIHTNLLQEVMGMQDPDVVNKLVPIIKAHIVEHFAWAYRLRISAELEQKTGVPLPLIDPSDTEQEWKPMPQDVENQVARAVAKFVAPPPAPPPPPDSEAGKNAESQAKIARADQESQAGIKRQDGEAQAKIARDNAVKHAELQRNGLISDAQTPNMMAAVSGAPSFTQGTSPAPQ